MEEKYFETRLETLLMNKPFNELVADEKKYALAHLSEEEYREYHLIISNYKAALGIDRHKVQPSGKVKTALTQAFRHQNNSIGLLTQIKQHKGWLAGAAAIVALIACTFVLMQLNKAHLPQTVKINRQTTGGNKLANRAAPHKNTSVKQSLMPSPRGYSMAVAQKNNYGGRNPAIKNNYSTLCLNIPAVSGGLIAPDSLATTPCLDPMNTSAIMWPDDSADDIKVNELDKDN